MHLAIEVLHEVTRAQRGEQRADESSQEGEDEGALGSAAPSRRTWIVLAPSGDGRPSAVQLVRERWILRGHRTDKTSVASTIKGRAAPFCALHLQCGPRIASRTWGQAAIVGAPFARTLPSMYAQEYSELREGAGLD
jgi:hypothetical protein